MSMSPNFKLQMIKINSRQSGLTILVESIDVYLYCISVIIQTSFDQLNQLDQPSDAILLLFISAAIGYFP